MNDYTVMIAYKGYKDREVRTTLVVFAESAPDAIKKALEDLNQDGMLDPKDVTQIHSFEGRPSFEEDSPRYAVENATHRLKRFAERVSRFMGEEIDYKSETFPRLFPNPTEIETLQRLAGVRK